MKSYRENILIDTLCNLGIKSGATDEKCIGICQGLITWQMYEGKLYVEAINWLKREIYAVFTPIRFVDAVGKLRPPERFLPSCWVEDFKLTVIDEHQEK